MHRHGVHGCSQQHLRTSRVHEVEQGEGPAGDLHDEEEGYAQAEGGFFRHGMYGVGGVLADGRFARMLASWLALNGWFVS
jgi:hypothetical protein